MKKQCMMCGLFTLGVVMIGLIAGCPDVVVPPAGDPVEFTNADGITGGKYYDKFYASDTGFDQNNANLATISASGDFFRCKQCHGWDRLGNAGAYIGRSPKTTRPNVSGIPLATHVDEMTVQELFDAIKTGEGATRRAVDADLSTYDPADPTTTTVGDQMPDFSQIFTDAEIWNIVKYLKDEVLDSTQLYTITTTGTYPDGSASYSNWGPGGDATNGDALYASKCAGCHGADGIGGAFPIEGGAISVGSHLRDKPYETWHKAKFGHPGSSMSPQGINTLSDMLDLYSALADTVMYPDPAP